MSHPLGAGFALAVGIIAAGLAVMGLLAYQRSKDKRILLVTSAFALFAVKGVLLFVDWLTGAIGHNLMEILATAMDLGVVVLLVAPFFGK